MKKSLFTMALVAAGAVIYLLSKDKEEEKSETPEIRLIDLKKDNNEVEEDHDDVVSETSKTDSEPVEEVSKEPEAELNQEQPKEVEIEEVPEENISDLMDELREELQAEPEKEELEVKEAEEIVESEPENENVEEVKAPEEIQPEPVAEPVSEEPVEEVNESLVNEVENESLKSEPIEEVHEENTHFNEETVTEETIEPEEVKEENAEVEDEDSKKEEDSDVHFEDLSSKILNEIEQESVGFNQVFTPKKEESTYSGTVYEISDLYPYLSYEMIDKTLDANVGFNHVYHDNQPIRIIHRVGFDKIEDLIEFVILIKEHDYRVEENNGLDMISISKDLIVEDMIIMSDIFNVSNQVYRLHGHYQGYEIIEL